jgi:cytoskeletal protein RodZ
MPSSSPDRAALARERLAAKRQRASNLRRRLLAGVFAAFVLAWGVIAFNGSMGQATTTASTGSTAAPASSTNTSDDEDWDDSSSDDEDDSTSSSDDPVTTAQS